MYFCNKELGNDCNFETKGTNWDSSSVVNQKWTLLFEGIWVLYNLRTYTYQQNEYFVKYRIKHYCRAC